MKNTNAFTRRTVLMLGTLLMAGNLAFASHVRANVAPHHNIDDGGCGGTICGSNKPCSGSCICRPAFGSPACYTS